MLSYCEDLLILKERFTLLGDLELAPDIKES